MNDVRETANGIPNSKLIVYEKFGHDLVMRNCKKIQIEIREFLKSN